MHRRSQHVLHLAAATAVAAATVGLLAFESPLGREADARSLAGFEQLTSSGRVSALANAISHWTPPLVVLTGALLVAIALFRGRRRVAIAVPLAMGAAVGTSELLKLLISSPRYGVGLGLIAPGAGSWPSGHTTAAMITALCAVLVAPARLRPVVAVAGSVAVLAVSYSMLAIGAHFPSDVLGGLLVAAMWMSLTLYALWRREGDAVAVRVAPALADFRTAFVTGALAAAGLAALAIAAAARPGAVSVGGSLLVAAVVVAALSATLTGGLVAALQSHRRLSLAPARASRRPPAA
jgi:membrane-associated phospholipid phosphatase